MNTETPTEETRPPFKLSGWAAIKHLNVRKEGPEDEQILAVDVKLELKKVDWRFCDYFDPALAPFLWRGDTDAMIVRNAFLAPVLYAHLVSSAHVAIDDHTFVGCDVKKFAIQPQDGGVLTLTCSVTLYPTATEVADLAKRVQDEVTVALEGPPDMFAAEPAKPAETVVANFVARTLEGSPDPDKTMRLVELASALVLAPDGRASISWLQRKLKIGYNEAARVLEILERNGIVGPMNSSGQREILTTERKTA
jgi:hypothetical protein